MALNINDTKFLELICEEGLSGFDKAIQIIINQIMLIEGDKHLKKYRWLKCIFKGYPPVNGLTTLDVKLILAAR